MTVPNGAGSTAAPAANGVQTNGAPPPPPPGGEAGTVMMPAVQDDAWFLEQAMHASGGDLSVVPEDGQPQPPVEPQEESQQQEATGEQPGERPPDGEQPPQDERFRQRFEYIAQKEREFRELDATIKQREEKLAAFEKTREEALLNPVAYLEAVGLTVKDVNEFFINGPSEELKSRHTRRTVEQTMEEERAKIRKEREELEAERAREKAERDVRTFQSDIERLATSAGPKWNLVAHFKEEAYEKAAAVLNGYHQKTGKLPGDGTREGALRAVLDVVQKDLEKSAERWWNSPYVQAKVKPQVAAPAPQVPSARQLSPPPRTLSNSMAGAAPPRGQPNAIPTDSEYYIQQAAGLLGGSGGPNGR